MKEQYNTPGTYRNIIKLRSQCRNRDFDIKKKMCRGCIGVQICAITLGVEDLNILMDNFRYYVDLSKHTNYGYCEVKTATLIYEEWIFSTRRLQEYDNLFLVCMDENEIWKCVERIYVIPWEEAIRRSSIRIIKNPNSSREDSWYRNFRIDEKPFNNIYHNMSLECCMLKK